MASTVPPGRGLLCITTQALRAWLLSTCPSGTKALLPSNRLTNILAPHAPTPIRPYAHTPIRPYAHTPIRPYAQRFPPRPHAPLHRPFVRDLGVQIVLAVVLVAFHLVRTVVGSAFLGIALFGFWAKLRGHFCFHPGDQVIEPFDV
jgi:hypothetical protein